MKNFYLLFLSIAFIVGILFSASSALACVPAGAFMVLITFLFAAALLSANKNGIFTLFLFLLVVSLGAFRYTAFNRTEKNDISHYLSCVQGKIFIQGEVINDPEEKLPKDGWAFGKPGPSQKNPPQFKQRFVFKANYIKENRIWKKASGLTLVNLTSRKQKRYKYGDILALEGFLRKPFTYSKRSNFNYSNYLANKKIYCTLTVKKGFFKKKISQDKSPVSTVIRGIYSLRAGMAHRIEKYFAYPHSSMLEAIMIGRRQNIPSELRELFARTGTLHILAISGLHVGIIYFVVRLLLKILMIPRNPAVIICILFLAAFAVLTGARASILRAGTMFSILAFSEIFQRKVSIFNLIGLSCLFILITCPNQVFDVGFILSYVAVLSIVSISPAFYELFSARGVFGVKSGSGKAVRYLMKSIAVSLAVWVGLMPLGAYYFGLISPISVIANLIVVPLLFMVMGSALFFLILGFLLKLLAVIFAESTYFFLFALIKSTDLLNNIPFGSFEIESPGVISVILYYVLAAILIGYMQKRKN